ncbi:MAG: YceI family protein [Candidatus Delongbacteria bacterium]|nr:YceI family protein [Candidatus Delongbacteria bacterium]
MRNLRFKYLSLSIMTLLFAITATAQNVYKLNAKNSSLTVTGTSSLDDWELKATGLGAETGLKLKGSVVSEIEYVKFTSPVKGLKSDKNNMRRKARKALKRRKFPQIKFTMKGDEPHTVSGKNADITGMLTVAGKTKEIIAPVDFTVSSDRQFTVSGKVRLKMSDFGIDPPTAFFGTLKTGDEVEVKYNLEFTKVN